MITYLYWAAVFSLIAAVLFGFIIKAKKWKFGLAVSVLILMIAWGAYAFHFQQIFVKRYGGVMAIQVPDGQRHISATWKDENCGLKNTIQKTIPVFSANTPKANFFKAKLL